ncbi:MAG: WecB/TagA/CpsF family glycosyltransferase [Halioglobus sp.]
MLEPPLPTATYDGFEVKLLEREQLLDLFLQQRIFVSVNPLMIQKYADSLRPVVNNHVGYLDGIGLCLAIWMRGGGWSPRIAGSEIWLELIRKYPARRYAIIGGTDRVLDEALVKLRQHYPGIDVVYGRNGFFQMEAEAEQIADTLRTRHAEVIFLAMGTPRQELFAQKLFDRHPATYLGIGGSLDVYTGTLRAAPRWVKRIGLEWLWRWMLEPAKRTRMNLALALFALRVPLATVRFERSAANGGGGS